VNQLDQMTQQNAALVEESAAAAESLKDQAARLTQVVQIFRIDGLVSHALQAPSAPGPKVQPHKALAPARPVSAATRPPATALSRSAPAKKAPAPTRPALAKHTATAASGDEGDWESF
jgi:methyl-accepting chemotaxis protein